MDADNALTLNAIDFGQEHFGQASLGDLRRTQRLVKTANQIMCHPGGSLPQKLGNPANLKALYRLVDRREMTHEKVLETHRQRTLRLMSQYPGVVLTIHDTTQLDYTTRRSLGSDLGQIAKGRHRGYLCHNTLAAEAHAGGAVIGLANQILHKRPRVPRNETLRQRRQRKDRETRLWKAGAQGIGPTPLGCTWVDVCDRGGDVFEYLDYKHEQGSLYVIRSKHDRCLETKAVEKTARNAGTQKAEEEEVRKLHAHARALADLTSTTVKVGARPAKPGVAARAAREAQVRVAAGAVTLAVPSSCAGDHRDQPLDCWVLHVKELDAPSDEKPLEWILLTNVPTADAAAALERVGWYARRPVIEEYHKAQKSGCGIELPQFTQARRLQPVIALLSVVAVLLLNLRDAARQPESQQRPAAELVPAEYVQVLSGWRWQDLHRKTTAREFLLAVARLGGHLNRKSDGLPGWLTIWRGWIKLHQMVIGARLMARPRKRCG